jgi:hypothetical protein
MTITGLKLAFGGNEIVMAAGVCMELGKMMLVINVHKKWAELKAISQLYNMIVILALVFMTSAHVYGYLAQNFTETVTAVEVKNVELTALKNEKELIIKDIADIEKSYEYLLKIDRITRRDREMEKRGYTVKKARLVELSDLIAKAEIAEKSATQQGGTIFAVAKISGFAPEKVAAWMVAAMVAILEMMNLGLTLATGKAWGSKKKKRSRRKTTKKTTATSTPKAAAEKKENKNTAHVRKERTVRLRKAS